MGRAGEGRALSTAFLHGTGSSGQPLHEKGQLSGRNRSKQQHLVSGLGETGIFPPSLLGSGLGKDKLHSWVVRTQLHLLLIPPGLTWRRACSQPGSTQGYQVATLWGEPGSKSSSPYSSAPFPYKPLPANPAPGFGLSFYLQPHYYQRFASKNSSEN